MSPLGRQAAIRRMLATATTSHQADELRDQLPPDFQRTLWYRPDVRKRWIQRQCDEESVASSTPDPKGAGGSAEKEQACCTAKEKARCPVRRRDDPPVLPDEGAGIGSAGAAALGPSLDRATAPAAANPRPACGRRRGMSAVERRRRHVLETPGLVHVELCAADETTAASAAAALARLWPASTCWPPRRIPGEDGVVVDLVADPAPARVRAPLPKPAPSTPRAR